MAYSSVVEGKPMDEDERRTSVCLTRGVDESVEIGPDISVQVIAVSGKRVRLRITAPRRVQVSRPQPPPEKIPA